METAAMIFRPLAEALREAAARTFSPYDRPPSLRRGSSRPQPVRDRADDPWDIPRDDARPDTWDDRGGDARYGRRGPEGPSGPSRGASSGLSGGKLAALGGLALAAVLVVAATFAIEAQLNAPKSQVPGAGTGAGQATATTSGTPAGATATSGPSLAKRWAQVGPVWAQRAAFAESTPSRGYACGFADTNAQTGPINLTVTQDGGTTWQTLATPAKGAYCDVRVSTTLPQRIALFASAVCGQESCTSTDPSQLDISTDGGTHWSAATLPAGGSPAGFPTNTFAWAGNTLFDYVAGRSDGHYLATSTNGGAFAWVDQNITGLPAAATIIAGELRAVGTSVYVTFWQEGCADPQSGCGIIARTSDGGATWTHVAPTYTGTAYKDVGGIRLVAGAPGAPLIGAASSCQCAAAPLLRSTDKGATWTELPAFPSGYQAREFWTVETPDGTVFATFQNTDTVLGIYVLTPGASAWRLFDYPTGGQSWALEGASWDTKGHPTAIWGWSWSNDEVDGLWRHGV
jgi:hypothetical protein